MTSPLFHALMSAGNDGEEIEDVLKLFMGEPDYAVQVMSALVGFKFVTTELGRMFPQIGAALRTMNQDMALQNAKEAHEG